MKRKQVAAILLSLSMAFVSIMSPNSVSAFAAENAGTDMTEVIEVSDEMNEAAEPFEVEEENPVSTADEQTPDDAEETQDVESLEEVYAGETADESATEEAAEKEPDGEITEEDQIEETAEDASTAEVSEETQETIDEQEEADDVLGEETVPDTTEEPVTIIEEAVPEEEVQNDAMEYGSDDYPYKNSSTYPSNAADPWGYYYRQCTSFCAFRLNKTNGFALKNWYQGVNFGNANSWINAAKKVGITVNNTPAVGAVACWTTGTYGHVAWVCAVSGSNVTIEEYNWGTAEKYNKRTIAASNPSGYIHFKDIATCSHSWAIQYVQTAPTATAKGKWLFKCSKCGSTKTIDIPALGSTNIANGRYMILSKLGTDKYVSVVPGQNYQQGNIALYSKGKADQTFTITKNSNGTYLIKYGDYVLDVKGGNFAGTVQLYGANGTSSQEWYIESAGDGWYRLAAHRTYYNMDVANAGSADGTDITTWYNNGNDAQLFKLIKVADPVNVSNLTVTVNDSNLVYDGTAKTPAVTVKQNGNVVTKGYKVTYQNNVNAGLKTATVTITGDNIIYIGTKKVSFSIKPGKTSRGDMFNLAGGVKVTWNEVPGAKFYKVYREGLTDPSESMADPVIVTERLIGWDTKPGLTNGHAYRYRIVVSLTDKDKSGDSPLSYAKLMYRLKTVAIRSAKNTAAGKVTVTYDKTTSGDGYVLRYSEYEDMSNARTKVIPNANTTTCVLGGFTKGKTYYISIRVRKYVDGIYYYTTFGVAKKVTITK